MPALNTITPDKLARLIGTPGAPLLVDVRDAVGASLIPGSIVRSASDVAAWGGALAGRPSVIVDRDGGAISQGIAGWLRSEGAESEAIDGGFAAWQAADLPLVAVDRLPPRDAAGRTVWVTRARPKVDRIACPWLIRRFVDPEARFLFVPPGEVLGVAERFGAVPFDVSADGVFWSHRGEQCTFDVMVEEFGLAGMSPLSYLAAIVRGADTDRLDIVPEAAGLLAMSLGLSRMYAADLEQLDAGMLVYDALYRWCRDARSETHDWTAHKPRGERA
jgi:rhodanese-related sulfurtransferase